MDTDIIRKGFKNTVFVVFAQAISFCLGVARALILPNVLGVSNFGYWQVYLLYTSFVGVFAFGFNDGIYLKYGKYDYEELPKPIFRSSIRIFMIAQIIVMLLVSLLILAEPDAQKQLPMLISSLNIPIAGLAGVLIYVLQVTNQFKRYSLFTILDKVIILLVILMAIVFKSNQHMLIILADLFSKIVVLVLLVISCKEIIFGKTAELGAGYKELVDNVNVGIKLMLANFAGMLVLGFGRFIVERFESVEVYGTYSFAISTINMVLIFISAIGLVLYPTLSRIDEKRYGGFFVEINNMLGVVALVTLLSFFPLKLLVTNYMQEYIPIFEYLPIVFALIFIQTKMQILINPFYKLLREEKSMLFANLSGMLLAIVLVLSMYFASRSVTMVAIATFIAMTIRAYLSQIYLVNKLSKIHLNSYILEITGIGLFLILAYQNNFWIGLIGYFVVACILLIVRRHTILKFCRIFFKR